MFDSLSGGYAPIFVLAVAAAWLLTSVRSVVLRIVLAVFAPIGISLGWFFLPRLPDLFKPLTFGQDSSVPWGFMAAAAWSIFAVPVCLLATLAFTLLRSRMQRPPAS